MMSDMIQDTIVVGGGLAALYFCKLHVQDKSIGIGTGTNKKILLLEKEYFVGGRIQSFPIDEKHSLELGPGRFSEKHKKLIDLISELGLSIDSYKSSPILTFRRPFVFPPETGSKEKQIQESYPGLSQEDQKILKSYQWNPLDLLVDFAKKASLTTTTTKLIVDPKISFGQMLEKQVGKRLFLIIQDSTGFKYLFDQVSTLAVSDILQMYDKNLTWYNLTSPYENIPKKLFSMLLSYCPEQFNCKLGTEVTHIRYNPENKIFQIKGEFLGKTEYFFCRNLVLAVNLTALQKLFLDQVSNLKQTLAFLEDPLVSLRTHFRTVLLVRLFAQFPKNETNKKYWFDYFNIQDSIYTGTSLGIFLKTKIPGMIQFSYSDAKQAETWYGLIQSSHPEELTDFKSGQIFRITDKNSILYTKMKTELKFLFPQIPIPSPDFILSHICSVTYCVPPDPSLEIKSKFTPEIFLFHFDLQLIILLLLVNQFVYIQIVRFLPDGWKVQFVHLLKDIIIFEVNLNHLIKK